MKLKNKTCRVCKNPFPPKSSTSIVCGFDCAVKYTEQQRKKKDEKQAKQVKREHLEAVKKAKPKKWWANKAKTACHAYIRYRDRFKPCISCGTTSQTIQYAAGHFLPSGNNARHRYDEYNIHKQCNKRCNCELAGNHVGYKPKIIEKIGADHVEFMENDNGTYKYSIEELQDIEIYYKEKLKYLKQQEEL